MDVETEIKELRERLKLLERRVEGIEDAIRYVSAAPMPLAGTINYYESMLVHLWNDLVEISYEAKRHPTEEVLIQFTLLLKELYRIREFLDKTILKPKIDKIISYAERTARELKVALPK